MTEAPVTITPAASIQQAAVLMRQCKMCALPVVADDDTCIGIVTRTDVLGHLAWPAATQPGTVGDAELEHSMRRT